MTEYFTFVNSEHSLTPATKELWETRYKREKHILLPRREEWPDNRHQLRNPDEIDCTFSNKVPSSPRAVYSKDY